VNQENNPFDIQDFIDLKTAVISVYKEMIAQYRIQ
jgi:hypothetical protein